MALVRLGYSHVKVGEPLPFNLVDAQGRIWLKHGYLLQSENQLDRLIERGLFFEEIINDDPSQQAGNTVSVYTLASELAAEFESLFSQTAVDYKKIPDIAERIQELCELDRDACLANIQHHRIGRYSLRHSFHAAVMAEILLRNLDRPLELRLYAVAGALTMNICMLDIQDSLYRQNNPLTLEQKRAIVMHPQATIKALREQGIDHSVWLDVVEHHHEMIDGTGYSKRLQESALSIESQAVSLADRYCAMVSERVYRPGMLPSTAAKELLDRQSPTISAPLAAAFRQEIGNYPPGTLVLLANGEVAVVINRLSNHEQLLLRSLRAPSGIRYPEPPKRKTSSPMHAIKEALQVEVVKDFDWAMLWLPVQLEEQVVESADTA